MSKTIAAYVRVSSRDQNCALQEDAINQWAEAQGVEIKWFKDSWTGTTMERPGWTKLEKALRRGQIDTLIIWKIDRLGRTALGLHALFEELNARRVKLISLTDGFDLSTTLGRMVAGILASIAQWETEVRSERQLAGIAAAKARGVVFGVRSHKNPRPALAADKVKRLRAEGLSMNEIAKELGVTKQTCYNALNRAAAEVRAGPREART